MKRFALALALGVSLASFAAPARAEERMALSPAVQKAIKDLSAEEFSAREKAGKVLQQALAEQLKSLLSVEDDETRQRMTSLLEFQDGLTRWALEAIKLPKESREKVLAWGLKPDIVPLVAKAYSATPEKRMEGIKALGPVKDDEASWLLAQLLVDDQREVYIAAMDAVWDRKPTEEIVNALWSRAVEAGFAMYRPRVAAAAGAPIVLRGRVVAPTGGGMYEYRRAQDGDVATDTLIHLKAPQVADKLARFLGDISKEMDKEGNNLAYAFMPYNEGTRNVYRLIEAYKTPESVAFLLKQLDSKVVTRQPMMVNGKQTFISNRTAALVALINATGQKHEDYKLVKSNGAWNLQWAVPTEKDENEAIEKFKKWYAENKDKKIEVQATKPAEKPAEAPASRPADKNAAPADANAPAQVEIRVEVNGQPAQIKAETVIIRGN